MNFLSKMQKKYEKYEEKKLSRQKKKLGMLKQKAHVATQTAKYQSQISLAKKQRMDSLTAMLGTSNMGKNDMLSKDEQPKKRREVNDYW